MKKLNVIFFFAMLFASQAYGHQPFNAVAMATAHNRKLLSFTLPSEVNVQYYRIEAGNDSASFTIIGTVRSAGNSVHAKTYSYKLYAPQYTYYRVGRVGMDGTLQYSDIICSVTPQFSEPAIRSVGEAIANGH